MISLKKVPPEFIRDAGLREILAACSNETYPAAKQFATPLSQIASGLLAVEELIEQINQTDEQLPVELMEVSEALFQRGTSALASVNKHIDWPDKA